MNKSKLFSSIPVVFAVLGLFVGGCSAAAEEETDEPVGVETTSNTEPKVLCPSCFENSGSTTTLTANLGSGQGATAAAVTGTTPTTAVRWPASALKGSYVLTVGQPCSRVAANSGTALTMGISFVGSYANCS